MDVIAHVSAGMCALSRLMARCGAEPVH